MSKFTTVAKVGDIEVGKGQAFEVEERVIAIFNNDGKYFAIDDMCPHMGASLATGFLDGCEVACPWHGWRFDVTDGAWCDNRRIKTDAFEVRVIDGEIQVCAEPIPKDETTSEGEVAPKAGAEGKIESEKTKDDAKEETEDGV